MKFFSISLALATMLSRIFPGSAEAMTAQVQNVSVTIDQPMQTVYNYAANPENLPTWASGLSKSKLVKHGDAWIAESPIEKVKVQFAAPNSFEIVDHDGSEVIFTVFRQDKMSDEDFAKAVAAIKKDLESMKRKLEQARK